jgi:hypothetical protein
MKKIVKQAGIAALVLAMVFAMAVVGCAVPEEEKGEIDPALNGTWARTQGTNSWSFTFNDGNFEQSQNGNQRQKGTYTTKDGVINYTITHLHGDGYKSSIPELTESKWYSIQEVSTAVKLPSSDPLVNDLFKRDPATYSVAGNTLTLGGSEYTKTLQ